MPKLTVAKKFNFRTPKTRILITFLTFAIIGGGILVYQSFAFTGWVFWPQGSGGTTLIDYPLTHLDQCNTVAAGDYDAYGNRISVVAMTCAQYASGYSVVSGTRSFSYAEAQ